MDPNTNFDQGSSNLVVIENGCLYKIGHWKWVPLQERPFGMVASTRDAIWDGCISKCFHNSQSVRDEILYKTAKDEKRAMVFFFS